MSALFENIPCKTAGCPAAAPGSEGAGNAPDEFRLGIGIRLASEADSGPTEAPNNGFFDHSLSRANAERQILLEAGTNLKQDWLDQRLWRALATARDYRLPHWYLPLTPKGIERVLSGLGLGKKDFIAYFGDLTYKKFTSMNPNMPLWAFAGICLEASA